MSKDLTPLLRPRSIALIGVSDKNRWSRTVFENVRKLGYPGAVYLVNPGYSELWGERCYPDFAALPDAIDHASVMVSSRATVAVLQDGVRYHLKSATVFAAGLGEGQDDASRSRGTDIAKLCENSGLLLCGPNCLGTVSFHEKLCLFPSAQLAAARPGAVGMVSQSGGTVQVLVKAASDRGVGVSFAVSSGNELNLDLADYLEFLVADPATKVIALFIEAIRRPDAFIDAARAALAAGKPIICFKVGRHDAARQAAQSHTGAIAGDYAAFEAMCDRYGIVNCRTLEDVLETLLAFQTGRLPRGNRIAFVTTSGALVDLLHDAAADENLTLAVLSDDTKAALKALIREEVEPKNPLDAGAPSDLAAAADICRAVLDDPGVDMVAYAAWIGRSTTFGDPRPFRALADATDKPLLGFGRMHEQIDGHALQTQDDMGIPFLQGMESTVRAMKSLAFYGARRARPPIASLAPARGTPSELARDALAATLDRYDIAVPRSLIAMTPADAAAAADALGFPVVLKLQLAGVLHKSDIGGVKVDLRNREEVQRAAEGLIRAAGTIPGSPAFEGLLVQEMVRGVEFIVGARTDPLYGPLIAVGGGGIFVELLRDVTLQLLPVGEPDVASMLGEIRSSRLLQAVRGRPPGDAEALVAAIIGLGRLYLDHRTYLSDIEINPLIVRPQGQGISAVDVRLIWRNS